jgi:hypothetical protein
MTLTARSPEPAAPEATTSAVVVMPIHQDPDWTLFDALDDRIPIIVVDDSDGKLRQPDRNGVRFYDYAAQRDVMGRHYEAVAHHSSATRNFGHYLAYREGFDIILALDFDCHLRPGWLETHLSALTDVLDAPALEGPWINTMGISGIYARGYPYEFRHPDASPVSATKRSGSVKLHMGLWDGVVDMNGIDKLAAAPPDAPAVPRDGVVIASGAMPLCGMNLAFRREVTPAFFFLPDVRIPGTAGTEWIMSRHDDIWGGYVLERLMAINGDLVSFGEPVIGHTRQSPLDRVVTVEHWMHLLSPVFLRLVDTACADLAPASYADLYAEFAARYCRALAGEPSLPAHYFHVLGELGQAMVRWSDCFR